MKMAIVFEVPDGSSYDQVAAQMIRHHEQAALVDYRHWSFDMEMRPVAVVAVGPDDDLAGAVSAARREIDQDHPWIPGAIFRMHEGFKPLLLKILDLMA